MADTWFRFYNNAVNDPKVQRLSPALFRFWINILCLASSNSGWLPSHDDMLFSLRIPPNQLSNFIGKLVAAGLLDQSNEGLTPHSWNVRQYKSDGSTERVKRFRERHGSVSETLHETGPDHTIPRADTESKNRTIPKIVFGKKGGDGKVTILDPSERLNRFQRTLAQKPGNLGWEIVGAAADPAHPDYARCVEVCKAKAREIGKGWPKQWPSL